jgi:hypothetical protein
MKGQRRSFLLPPPFPFPSLSLSFPPLRRVALLCFAAVLSAELGSSPKCPTERTALLGQPAARLLAHCSSSSLHLFPSSVMSLFRTAPLARACLARSAAVRVAAPAARRLLAARWFATQGPSVAPTRTQTQHEQTKRTAAEESHTEGTLRGTELARPSPSLPPCTTFSAARAPRSDLAALLTCLQSFRLLFHVCSPLALFFFVFSVCPHPCFPSADRFPQWARRVTRRSTNGFA